MSKISGGVQVLPSLPADFKFKSRKPLATFDNDPPKLPVLGANKPLVPRAGPQSRPLAPPPEPSLPPPISAKPLAPAFTHPGQPTGNPPGAALNQQSVKIDAQKKRYSKMGAVSPFLPDTNFKTDKIKSLNLYNFQSFNRSMEKSLVMFYATPEPSKARLNYEFETAADRVQASNYGFGAVNCFLDNQLCCREQICTMPMFKLYSNGFQVSVIEEPTKFNAYQMEMLMKNSPVLTQPKATPTQQAARPVRRIIMGTRMLNR